MYIGLHVKYYLFLLDFNEPWILSTGYLKNTQKSNFMKIRPVGAETSRAGGRAEGRTERHHDDGNILFFFFNFANASKTFCYHLTVNHRGCIIKTNHLILFLLRAVRDTQLHCVGRMCACNAMSDVTYKYTYHFAWQGRRPNEIDRKSHSGIFFLTSLHVVPCHRRTAGHVSWFWCVAVQPVKYPSSRV